MPTDDDRKDPKVRELLAREPGDALTEVDAATAAELARWFAMPSVAEVTERGDLAVAGTPDEPVDYTQLHPSDPLARAEHARRVAALLEAVEPAIGDRIRAMVARDPITFHPHLDLTIERAIERFDESMIDRCLTINDPRQVEIHPDLEDVLKVCSPQALLRDLYRPETQFDKTFEVAAVDPEVVTDAAQAVRDAMGQRRPPPPDPFAEGRAARQLLADTRAERRAPWAEIRTPGRKPETDAAEVTK
jgi:hypothetical protein